MKFTLHTVSACLIVLIFSGLVSHAQQYADGFRGTNAATTNYFMGKVGIGTNASSQQLSVRGNIAFGNGTGDGYGRLFVNQKTARTYPTMALVAVDDGTDNELNFGGGTSIGYVSKKVIFHTATNDTTTGSSARMVINSIGNVGIGTLSPGAKLHVSGTANLDSTLYVTNGNVGIGTASPGAKLHVSGTANLGSTLYVTNSRVGIGTATPAQVLAVKGDVVLGNGIGDGYGRLFLSQKTARTYPTVVMVGADDGTANELNFGGGTSVGYVPKRIVFHTATNDTSVGNSPRMVIASSGRVGVGTTSPSELFHVGGVGRFDGGIAYVAPMGDLAMGSFTNKP